MFPFRPFCLHSAFLASVRLFVLIFMCLCEIAHVYIYKPSASIVNGIGFDLVPMYKAPATTHILYTKKEAKREEAKKERDCHSVDLEAFSIAVRRKTENKKHPEFRVAM